MLRFRVLGVSFSSFGCFVFEIWVLRALVFVFECFVFETTYPGDRLAIVFARRRFALVIFCRFFLVISAISGNRMEGKMVKYH